tara:strand:+ start:15 stop:1229 length:1215 start_codon:yes stop_codon:yes gene_type:complete
MGHRVFGIDTNQKKIDLLNQHICPIKEPGLEPLLIEALKNNYLKISTKPPDDFSIFDFSIICVGTPSLEDGSQNLSYVKSVCEEIGSKIKLSNNFHNILIRSTIFPGTTESIVKNATERASNKIAGIDFGLVMNPEFLRESSAIEDFFNPPYTIIGGINKKSMENASLLYDSIDSKIHHVSLKEAEILKMVNNAFHATKISFANEVGRLCLELEINSQKIMSLVCEDKKLNISNAYLKPGFAFGGSCLPKDLRALNYFGKDNNIPLALFESVLTSNEEHINFITEKLKNTGQKMFGILGLSFKPGTDDLRESPTIRLINNMINLGLEVLIYDFNVDVENLFGANKIYLKRMIPNYQDIIVSDINDISRKCNHIIISNDDDNYRKYCDNLNNDYVIIELSKIQSI